MRRMDAVGKRWRVGLAGTIVGALILAVMVATATAATTLTVSTQADSSPSGGACGNTSITTAPSPLTLREATCIANNIGGEVNISVPAGEYRLENGQLAPGRASGDTVNITGASAASTIINGLGNGIVLNIDELNKGGVNSTITGVTVTGGKSDKYGGAGIVSGANAEPFDKLTLRSVVVRGNVANEGAQTAGNKPGGGVQMSNGVLTVENSTIAENSSYSSPGGGISYFNQVNAPGQGVFIRNTLFEGNKVANSTEFDTGGAGLWINAPYGESEISGSRFVNNEATASSSGPIYGAGLRVRSGTTTVVGSTFTGNVVKSTGSGAALGAAVAIQSVQPSGLATATLHYDRIAGNTPGASAVANVESTSTVNATENWWGCNGGPGTAGCDGTSGTVPAAPRLELHGSASPTTVVGPNGTSTFQADFLTDSAGAAVSPSNLTAFNGALVTWSAPQPSPATINGKGSGETSTTAISAGKATATYNSSTSSGAGSATASFDNASRTVSLTVDRKPEVTSNPSNQQTTPGSSVSFTAAASGTPTPTVQWQRDKGEGAGFENISGATSTTYTFTAQSSETGWKFRAVFTNTIEGTPYTATTTAATLLVGKATPTLTSNATSATIGKAIVDTATLSGGSSPGGSVEFRAYGPANSTCTGSPAFTATKTVSGNAAYESGAYTPVAAGEYRWVVVYSGDSLNEEVKAACGSANETSTVSQATPKLSTTATGAGIGGEVHDTASFTGGYTPGGSITFKAFAPADTSCTGTAVKTTTVPVTANGTYESESFKPGEAGSYRWIATYSGDPNNKGATGTCGEAGETSTVSKATVTLSTSATSGIVGTPVHDTATIGGGFSPGGTITFRAYAPSDTTCGATAVLTESVAVTGDGTYESPAYTTKEAGSYRWIATYSGDANNNGTAGTCGEAGEVSTVSKQTPAISTSATSVALGGEVHDTANLTGGYTPGGSITFKAFAPADTSCTGTPVKTSTVPVTANGTYESEAFKPGEAGSYRWVATYSGDADNEGAAGKCGEAGETSSVGALTPSLSTKATNGTVGGQIHDVAELSGGFTPQGSITFKLFPPSDPKCEGSPVASTPTKVNGDGSYESSAYTTKEAGSYRWVADYSGDANNEAIESACGEAGETSAVAKALPAVATTASTGIAGGQIHDTAILSGGVAPTGSITFRTFAPADTGCTGTPVETSTVTVKGNGEYESSAYTAKEAGSYRWVATYSGDANNEAAAGACGESGETSTVGKASPSLSTSASDAAIGSAIHDTATLTGGAAAGGSITFEAFAPGDATCATAVETLTVTVNGAGTYGSGPFTPTKAGSYRWIATYSGDANNEGAAGTCGESGEASTVAKATPSLSTTATNAALGNPVHDTATLSGGYSPGGSITFQAYGPGDATCAAAPVFTKTVTVSGNGAYGSTDFTPAQVGEYRWVATYVGEGNNSGTAGTCGEAGETSIVAKAAPTLSTSATDATVGGQIHDTATLTGGQAEGGTLTFEAFGPGDATCTGTPVATSTVPVAGDGSYESDPYTAGEAGAYHWVVAYSGDGSNAPAESACGEAGETSNVAKAVPTISTSATPSVTLGGAVHDTATLAGGHAAGGTITFRAFAPSDTNCTGAPVFTDTVPVSGSGSYESGSFTPGTVGTYRWIASYSGDVNNQAVAGACGDERELSTVNAPPVVPTQPTPPVTAPPSICTAPPAPSAGGYVPKNPVKGHLVPGVRARVRIAGTGQTEVAATLHYRTEEGPQSVELGKVSLENPGYRNVRLALPAALRETLPLGTKVRLALTISTVPTGCSPVPAHTTHRVVHTKVLRILAGS